MFKLGKLYIRFVATKTYSLFISCNFRNLYEEPLHVFKFKKKPNYILNCGERTI